MESNSFEYSVSIIIPVFNGEKTIRNAIFSIVENLSFLKYEIIVIDDGSTDRTCDVLKEIISSYSSVNIKLTTQKNSGVSAARNRGISLAENDLILFLDSDDLYLKDIYSFIVFASKNYSEYDFYTASYIINSKVKLRNKSNDKVIEFLKNQYFCTNSVIVKKSILQTEKFREGFNFGEDVDLWLRLMIKYRHIHCDDLFVARYCFSPKIHDSRNHPFYLISMSELNLSDEYLIAINKRFMERGNLITSFKRECTLIELVNFKSINCFVAYLLGESGYKFLWKIKNLIKS